MNRPGVIIGGIADQGPGKAHFNRTVIVGHAFVHDLQRLVRLGKLQVNAGDAVAQPRVGGGEIGGFFQQAQSGPRLCFGHQQIGLGTEHRCPQLVAQGAAVRAGVGLVAIFVQSRLGRLQAPGTNQHTDQAAQRSTVPRLGHQGLAE